jgi:hypothetical protein
MVPLIVVCLVIVLKTSVSKPRWKQPCADVTMYVSDAEISTTLAYRNRLETSEMSTNKL